MERWTFCESGGVERLWTKGYRLQVVEGFRRLGFSHGGRFEKSVSGRRKAKKSWRSQSLSDQKTSLPRRRRGREE